MKRIILIFLVLFFSLNSVVSADEIYVPSNAAILIERSTGQILYEKNSEERLPMASVTKTMTMLLAIEAVDSGKITMDDIVTVSENGSSMTGSRVYLSTNEKISVSDLLKSIAVSSGNDAAVTMAEYVAGNEESFVALMNKRAEELGLENTHFVNCCGLDAEGHYSSAHDLAAISDELLKHDSIRPFLVIWMDSIRDGTFTLSNTNKLVRYYDGCTGVKTGFTSQAMYCLSASALRDDMELIAVILGGPNSKQRFADASALLNYGFANYKIEKCASEGDNFGTVNIEKGTTETVSAICEKDFSYLSSKSESSEITNKIKLNKNVCAPVKKGDKIGSIIYFANGNKIGTVNLVSDTDVSKCGLLKTMNKLLKIWFEF